MTDPKPFHENKILNAVIEGFVWANLDTLCPDEKTTRYLLDQKTPPQPSTPCFLKNARAKLLQKMGL